MADDLLDDRMDRMNAWLMMIQTDTSNSHQTFICDQLWRITTNPELQQTSPQLKFMVKQYVKEKIQEDRPLNCSIYTDVLSKSVDLEESFQFSFAEGMSYNGNEQRRIKSQYLDKLDPNDDPEKALDLDGQWELYDNTNFEEQLEQGRKLGWAKRKLVLSMKQKMRITQKGNHTWNLLFEVFGKSKDIEFKSDKSAQIHEELDGSKQDAITQVEDNKLVNITQLPEGTNYIHRQREGADMVAQLSLNGIVCKRLFRKID